MLLDLFCLTYNQAAILCRLCLVFVLEVWEERSTSLLTRLYDVLCQTINDNVAEINMTQRHLRPKLCPLLPSGITFYHVRALLKL